MNKINLVKKNIAEEFSNFKKYFNNILKSDIKLLDLILKYIINRKGKQIRPILVLLSAKLNGQINDRTYRACSFIELIHTATLIHDDVIDDSFKRRNFFSINAIWKNKISILVGDFLLSKALINSIDNNDFNLLRIISKAIKLMSIGELLQLQESRKLNINENIYFNIIKMKTASLMGACCQIGAESVNSLQSKQYSMYKFGELIGMAFQIKDDILDYNISTTIGKSSGLDLLENKITLPLIYCINNSSFEDRKWLMNCLRSKNTIKRNINKIINYVKLHDGIKYSETIIQKYIKEAMEILYTFEKNKYRDYLELIVEYISERKN